MYLFCEHARKIKLNRDQPAAGWLWLYNHSTYWHAECACDLKDAILRRGVTVLNTSSKPWVDNLTIGRVLRFAAQSFPAQDALVYSPENVRYSYGEFDWQVDRVARGLIALGFRQGDHFGVWSTNCPEWVLLQFATARIGVVLVTINPAYQCSELEYTLSQSEIQGLALIDGFRSTDYFAMLDEMIPEMRGSQPGELRSTRFPKLRWIVNLRGSHPSGTLTWDELCHRGNDVPLSILRDHKGHVSPDDPINLQYTSGTTGSPKGALLTHRNLLLNAFYAGECQNLTEVDRICIPVPLYHCFGCVLGTLCAVIRGAAMVFPYESFDAGKTLQAVERDRCTAIYGVPTMFISELEHPEFGKYDTSTLRTGIMAGSPCPIELMKRVTTEMGAREITIGYGQTEASPLITQTRTGDDLDLRVGTVGLTIPGVDVIIIDPETGAELPDETTGELCTRGHNVMVGYYNMPEQTSAAIDDDGWLHTGDLAIRLPNGYFRITGRLKDMIIRGGENISPREIEELLYQHPKVEDVQVLGVPSRKFGEQVLAFVKLRARQTCSEDEIRDFCRASLARFKTPHYVLFTEHFPTTVTGKIQKFKLRELAIEQLGLHSEANIETA